MAEKKSLVNIISKPEIKNKRYFALFIASFAIIAGLGAIYYFHIENQEIEYKQYRLHTLENYFHQSSITFDNLISITRSQNEKAYLEAIKARLEADIEKSKKLLEQAKKKQAIQQDEQLANKKGEAKEDQSFESRRKMIQEIDLAIYDNEQSLAGVQADLSAIKNGTAVSELKPELQHQFIEPEIEVTYRNLPWAERFDAFIVKHTMLSEGDGNAQTIKSKDWMISNLKGNLVIDEDSLFGSSTYKSGVVKIQKINETNYRVFARKFNYEVVSGEGQGKTKLAEVMLIGLVKDNTYFAQTHRLDSWVLSLLATVLMLFLFGIPFFKMVFISEDERLFGNDVILAGISVLVGTPIIIIVFLALFSYSKSFYFDIPDQLKEMALDVERAFTEENEAILDQLSSIKLDDIKAAPQPDNDASDLYKPITSLKSSFSKYSEFKYLSKVKADGQVAYHLNFVQKPKDATMNLARRPYFLDYEKGRDVWRSEEDIAYVMRPVISIENQTHEAVYMLHEPSDPENYIVASLHLKSLNEPLMSAGYQCAVVAPNGQVWFHSNKKRAVLENFFSVSGKEKQLEAAIKARVQVEGMMQYHGRPMLYSVRPIKNTSMSVIILYDVGLLRLKVSEVLSISAIAVLIAFLVACLLALISAYGKSHRWRLHKYRSFLFHFLEPQSAKKKDYIFLYRFFSGLIVVCLIAAALLDFSPSEAFLSSMMFIIWSYVLVYYRLEPGRLVKIVHLLLEGKFRWGRKDVRQAWVLAFAALQMRDILIFMGLIGLNTIMFTILGQSFNAIILLLQAGFVIFLIRNLIHAGREKEARLSHMGIRFKLHYTAFLCSWLMVTSVLPAYFYFVKAWDLEGEIWQKHAQLVIADRYMKKERELKRMLIPLDELSEKGKADWREKTYDWHLSAGRYFADPVEIMHHKTEEGESQWPNADINLIRRMYWRLRPVYDQAIFETQPLIFDHASDNSWRTDVDKTNLTLGLKEMSVASDKDMVISRSKLFRGYGREFNKVEIVAFTLLIGAIVGLLFYVIQYYADRFFGFRFQHLRTNDFDTNVKQGYAKKFADMMDGKVLSSLGNQEVYSNSGLMIIGPPFTGKRSFAREIIRESDHEEHYAQLSCFDFSNLGEPKTDEDKKLSEMEWTMRSLVRLPNGESAGAEWINKSVFIIANLDHDIRSSSGNMQKLRMLTHLLSLNKRLLILSEVYPGQILSYYKEMTDSTGGVSEALASEYTTWRNLLGEFPQIVLGLTPKDSIMEGILERIRKEDNLEYSAEDNQFVIRELGFSRFLPSLTETVMARNSYHHRFDPQHARKLDRERMVLHIQNLAHGYYNDIWNSLANRERYLLYDLATDGFMNIKNNASLFSLMKKGLVVWDNKPMIFNLSFRNFIISSAEKAEALELEQKNKTQGAWSFARIIIYLIIFTIVGFLVLGEPGIIDDFQTFLGAVASIGALLPIVSSLLSGGRGK